jgi:short-subunit dehydrogenase
MGIGAACARAFGRRGARLILTARSKEALEDVCRSVGPGSAVALPADLRRPAEVADLAERALGVHGAVDVLVNNAGVGLYLSCCEAAPAQVRELMEVNLLAPLELIRRLAPQMRRRGGGMVINVSSVAGKVPLPWLTIYSASKAALNYLSDGLRMELAGSGVRVMSVCPGFVTTGFPDHALGGRIPQRLLRRRRFLITAEQCAEAIARGVERERRTVVVPRVAWLLVAASKLFPGTVHAQLARMPKPVES